ncbi:MAG: D-alanyl-D-alanine carboxypeptidase [Bacilli bacterium]|nr:D-alanyl-D-alanine carboxypeptidase [Bacilli bacterium]
MLRQKWINCMVAAITSLTVACSFYNVSPIHAAAAATPAKKMASQPAEIGKTAISAVLMDAASGQVIFEKNPHQKLPPASVTKVMTLLLIMEAIDAGRIKITDKVRTTEHAASMGGSQVYLEPGEEMTLDDMLKSIALASANDAAVAVAESLCGSEEEFVRQMNERAAALGCKDTHFVNTNGLPVKEHYTSAYDLALISRELVKHQVIFKYTGKYDDYLRKDSTKPFWLVNTNKMVKWYAGMDGLKTGFTSEARYCLAASAKRGNFRVIAVVMGEPSSKIRNAEVGQMMDWAFANYTSELLYQPGQVVQSIRVANGRISKLPLVAAGPVAILMRKGQKREDFTSEIVLDKISAPIKKGQVIGFVLIKNSGVETSRIALAAGVDIDKATWWQLTRRTLTRWLTFGSAGND